jgi:folate-binding Fe-S cluster repair protein YgfZ
MQANLMNDIGSSGSSELGTKDTVGEVFLSDFPVSVDVPECNGMESVTKNNGVGLDGSAEMIEKIVAEDGENLMDDIQDREEGDYSLPRSGSVDLIQVNQDAEDSISSLLNAENTGDGIQDDPDGEETLDKFKRPRRSKKSVVKNALEDDIGNEVEIPRDKDKSLSKGKAVRESDGENIVDNAQGNPDGEEGDHSSPKSRSVLDGMQVSQDAEESIWSLHEAKSIGDGMQDDPDGQETVTKFKRLRRSKKTVVKVALEDDVGNEMEVLMDKDKILLKDKTVRESDGETIMDGILSDPDEEEGDHSSPKFRSVVDGMQAIQDTEESILSLPKANSIRDSRVDLDGQESLAKSKRPRRSKKAAVKVVSQDDVGNEMEVPIDKDKSSSKDKAVHESDGENLMDDIQVDPDGEQGDHSSQKSRIVVRGMQVIKDLEESGSLLKAKSVGDGMWADPDGQETLAKFKRLRRSKKAAVKAALQDGGNEMEVPIDKGKSLSKDKAVRESDGRNLMDDIPADPDGEEGDYSSRKSTSIVDSMQVIQDAQEIIPSLSKDKSIGDGMQDDPDGQETLAKFKRPRRSKKAVAKVALQDDVGNEMEVPIDKDKSLLNNKAVLELDGENLMDNIQAEPDGEAVGHSLPKSGSLVDGIQDIQDAQESIPSLSKDKSIGDGMQDDPDGQETLAKFKRPRRSKKKAAKVALQDDVGNEMKVPIDKEKSLLNNTAVLELDGENLMDNIQAEPDGEEVGHSLPKSGSVVDGIQDIQDAQESIPSLSKDKSIGDGMQDDPDGQETLAKFKRPRRSKKAAAKVALQDEVGNEMEVPIDKDKSLLNNKSVLESDGENLMDNIQAEPDGEEVGHLLTKSGSVVDGIQDTEDVEESILSLPKAKSIGDGMQEDPDGEETLAKFKRPRRSKKAVVKDALEDIGNEVVPTDKDKSSLKDKAVRETDDIPAKIKKPRRLKKREVKDALEVDVTKATETSIDTNQNLKVNIAEDSENTLTHFKKKKKTPKYAKDLPKVALASRHASASENDIKETANTDQVSKLQKTDGSSQGSPSALVEKTRASKGAKSGKGSLESNPDGAVKGYAVKASDIKKGKKQSDSQRAVRHVKKRRLGDMAYEGDSDWDVLMNGEEALESKSSVDKERPGRGRNRAGLILSMLGQVVPGEEAAVAAGLKVRQPGPVEKIKFKEVLKRRGGLQEYLECRLVYSYNTDSHWFFSKYYEMFGSIK